jgi:hypothetical protein
MRRGLLATSGLTTLLACAACAAHTISVSGTNAAQQDTKKPAATAAATEAVICKTYPPPIGSLLSPRRICHTDSDWKAITRDAQDQIKDVQTRAQTERLPGN